MTSLDPAPAQSSGDGGGGGGGGGGRSGGSGGGSGNSVPWGATSLDARRPVAQPGFAPHMCLGDLGTYRRAEAAARVHVPADAADAAWLRTIDATSVPQEVWDGAQLLPDARSTLLRYCLELQQDR
jgi:hypothetical protein